MVAQEYRTEPSNEDIISGNDALMKCKVPSFVADFAAVVGWVDSEATEYLFNNNNGNFIRLRLIFQVETSFKGI